MMVIYHDKGCLNYPDKKYKYSPHIDYPEYQFGDLSQAKNDIYDMVRNTFILADLDKEHMGTSSWNPLGEYIKPGQKVLLKPNWVENKNKYSGICDGLSCLVTHPSIVRVILDYVIIALKGKGNIYIADAPMQGCDLQDMFKKTGYNDLFDFYHMIGIEIKVCDLRKYSVKDKYTGVFTSPILTENPYGSIRVDIGSLSMHSEKDATSPNYKVEDYPITLTKKYHSAGSHIYEVNSLSLYADVIINLPKPKTHRLTGFTGACKNFVGVTYEKASLPHRIDRDTERNGGDAYYKYSYFKNIMSMFNEKRTKYSRDGNYIYAKVFDYLMKASYILGVLTTGDKYRIGSWYGNDTMWRTVVDLNTAILYANSNGQLQNSKQRTIISVGDMIISGEREGPVGPSPKPMGMILFSDNNLSFDRALCAIIGFDENVFPLFNNEKALRIFGFKNKESLEKTVVKSNNNYINGIQLRNFPMVKEWNFEPQSCWKGHVEKGKRR